MKKRLRHMSSREILERYVPRLQKRREMGIDAVLNYLYCIPPRARQALLEAPNVLSWAEKVRYERYTNQRQAQKAERLRALVEPMVQQMKRAEEERRRALEQLEKAIIAHRKDGIAARYAASTAHQQRDLDRYLTKEERIACREFRRSEVFAGKACEILGCSRLELDRWVGDGRLSVFRKKFVPGLPKLTRGRTFLLSDLLEAKAAVPTWREQDRVQRAFRRKGLRVAGS